MCIINYLEERNLLNCTVKESRHILPDVNNLMQLYFSDTEEFPEQNKPVINKKKTKAILFNKSQKWDFPLKCISMTTPL